MTNEPHESKIIMLSFPDIKFIISFFFNFERCGIESRFPFFYTHVDIPSLYEKKDKMDCFMNLYKFYWLDEKK